MDLYKIIEKHQKNARISLEEAWCMVEQYMIDRTGEKPKNVKLDFGIPKHQHQLNHAFGVAVKYFMENRVNLGLAIERLNK
jgi:hypothetical protein